MHTQLPGLQALALKYQKSHVFRTICGFVAAFCNFTLRVYGSNIRCWPFGLSYMWLKDRGLYLYTDYMRRRKKPIQLCCRKTIARCSFRLLKIILPKNGTYLGQIHPHEFRKQKQTNGGGNWTKHGQFLREMLSEWTTSWRHYAVKAHGEITREPTPLKLPYKVDYMNWLWCTALPCGRKCHYWMSDVSVTTIYNYELVIHKSEFSVIKTDK